MWIVFACVAINYSKIYEKRYRVEWAKCRYVDSIPSLAVAIGAV